MQVLNCINGGNTYNIQTGENCANGGLATDAWLWAQYNGGITSESQLPYLAGPNPSRAVMHAAAHPQPPGHFACLTATKCCSSSYIPPGNA